MTVRVWLSALLSVCLAVCPCVCLGVSQLGVRQVLRNNGVFYASDSCPDLHTGHCVASRFDTDSRPDVAFRCRAQVLRDNGVFYGRLPFYGRARCSPMLGGVRLC